MLIGTQWVLILVGIELNRVLGLGLTFSAHLIFARHEVGVVQEGWLQVPGVLLSPQSERDAVAVQNTETCVVVKLKLIKILHIGDCHFTPVALFNKMFFGRLPQDSIFLFLFIIFILNCGFGIRYWVCRLGCSEKG